MPRQVSHPIRNVRLNTIVLLASLMLCTTPNHAQQYYKWVDSKGSTHYTTTPPPKSAKKQGKVNTYGNTSGTLHTPTDTSTPSQPAQAKAPSQANPAAEQPPQNTPHVQEQAIPAKTF